MAVSVSCLNCYVSCLNCYIVTFQIFKKMWEPFIILIFFKAKATIKLYEECLFLSVRKTVNMIVTSMQKHHYYKVTKITRKKVYFTYFQLDPYRNLLPSRTITVPLPFRNLLAQIIILNYLDENNTATIIWFTQSIKLYNIISCILCTDHNTPRLSTCV